MKTNYAIHRPVVNAYLVRERDRRRWRDLGTMLLLILPLAFSLFVYTWIHLQLLDTGYEINRDEKRVGELEELERRLELERERLTSPSRIEAIASQSLGLSPPRRDQMVFVELPNDGATP